MHHAPDGRALLVVDTSVLLNFAVLDRLNLFAESGFRTYIPNHVLEEVRSEGNRARVDAALDSGLLVLLEITDLEEMTRYAAYRRRFGDGESAALAVGLARGWAVAVDEMGPVRREVIERLGDDHLVTTPRLLERAVKRGALALAELPASREELARNRYFMDELPIERERG